MCVLLGGYVLRSQKKFLLWTTWCLFLWNRASLNLWLRNSLVSGSSQCWSAACSMLAGMWMLVSIITEQALLVIVSSLQFLTVVFDLHFLGLKILNIIAMYSFGIFFFFWGLSVLFILSLGMGFDIFVLKTVCPVYILGTYPSLDESNSKRSPLNTYKQH